MSDTVTDKADRDASDQTKARLASEGAAIEQEPRVSEHPPPGGRLPRRRILLTGVVGALALVVACVFGIPWIGHALNTVSTDDAYVSGHGTFVASRIGGELVRVLVDDNNRVRKGQLLAELDKEPYQHAVSQKQAAVETAMAYLLAAGAAVRGNEPNARS